MKYAMVLLILLLGTIPAAAQQTCNYGLPCGPIRWALPALPALESPTPVSTIFLSATPSPTATPTGTITPATAAPTVTPTPSSSPTATNTPPVDLAGINDSAATLQAIVAATDIPLFDELGTPVSRDDEFDELAASASEFFGYAKGLTELNFGSLTPLLLLSFTALVVIIMVRLTTFFLPLIGALLGMVRRFIDFVMQFIPL